MSVAQREPRARRVRTINQKGTSTLVRKRTDRRAERKVDWSVVKGTGGCELDQRERTMSSTHRAVPSVDTSIRLQLGPPGDASWDGVRGGCRIRALGHRDAAWEVRHDRAENGFVRERVGRGARVHVCVRVEAALILEHRAVLDDARGGRTLVHGAREHAAVPAVHEVSMQSVTGWVAV
jgi:hypothetical protein